MYPVTALGHALLDGFESWMSWYLQPSLVERSRRYQRRIDLKIAEMSYYVLIYDLAASCTKQAPSFN